MFRSSFGLPSQVQRPRGSHSSLPCQEKTSSPLLSNDLAEALTLTSSNVRPRVGPSHHEHSNAIRNNRPFATVLPLEHASVSTWLNSAPSSISHTSSRRWPIFSFFVRR